MSGAIKNPPIVSLGAEWGGIGVWCDGINRCSRGDCRYYEIPPQTPGVPQIARHSVGLCRHHDAGLFAPGHGLTLCVPFYKELTRRYSSLLLEAAKGVR